VVAEVWLVRHGETEWSRDHRHTSRTDVPLTEAGTDSARGLRGRLAGVDFTRVLTSQLQRARRTAELAGFAHAEVDERLREWDYSDYEGVTTSDIREESPGWSVWTHPVPGGEAADEVAARLDQVLAELRRGDGRVLLFGHAHATRALAARWLGLPVSEGRLFRLDTGTVSVLGHERETSVILRWNT